MITLFENQLKGSERQSSKGNQLKWETGGIWYKADYLGYEGLSEYIASAVLSFSSLNPREYVRYNTEEISYKKRLLKGSKSSNFLPAGWQMITIERLFRNRFGKSIGAMLYGIPDIRERLRFLTEQVKSMTGIRDFGIYMNKILTIDALLLNEDRHTHNIAVLCDPSGNFHLCPIFDNGSSLLSDTTLDYPISGEIYELIDTVHGKTLCDSFYDALTVSEELYGENITFRYTWNDITKALEEEKYYGKAEKERVRTILMEQRRKYSYLFHE